MGNLSNRGSLSPQSQGTKAETANKKDEKQSNTTDSENARNKENKDPSPSKSIDSLPKLNKDVVATEFGHAQPNGDAKKTLDYAEDAFEADFADETIPMNSPYESQNATETLVFPELKESTSLLTPSRYSAIAGLDKDQDDEKWIERTTVITKIDHEHYLDSAREVVNELIDKMTVPETRDVVSGGAETPLAREK